MVALSQKAYPVLIASMVRYEHQQNSAFLLYRCLTTTVFFGNGNRLINAAISIDKFQAMQVEDKHLIG